MAVPFRWTEPLGELEAELRAIDTLAVVQDPSNPVTQGVGEFGVRAAEYLSSTTRNGVKSIRGRTMEVVNADAKIARCYPYIDAGVIRHGVPTLRMRSADGTSAGPGDPKVKTYGAYIDAFGVRRWRNAKAARYVCDGLEWPAAIKLTIPCALEFAGSETSEGDGRFELFGFHDLFDSGIDRTVTTRRELVLPFVDCADVFGLYSPVARYQILGVIGNSVPSGIYIYITPIAGNGAVYGWQFTWPPARISFLREHDYRPAMRNKIRDDGICSIATRHKIFFQQRLNISVSGGRVNINRTVCPAKISAGFGVDNAQILGKIEDRSLIIEQTDEAPANGEFAWLTGDPDNPLYMNRPTDTHIGSVQWLKIGGCRGPYVSDSLSIIDVDGC